MTLGGYICVRNGDELDYCWREAVASLLPVCDEVIICDSDSTDGTREAADRWADVEPKIRVVNYPWPKPKGETGWWTAWLNFAREHLKTELQICLDADEILSDHPECHKAIREAIADGQPKIFNRINFWKDANHTIPEGHAIGKWVVRMGPRQWWMPSDEGHSSGELPIIDNARRDPRLEIFHMGFLRRKDAFWKKARVVLSAFFDTYDSRLEKVEQEGKTLADIENCEWTDKITPWQGYMPDSAQKWLAARGHNTNHYVGMNEREQYLRVRVVPPEPEAKTYNVLHVGDYGDIIHSLPILKAMGSVNLFVRDANHLCKRIVHRLPGIEALLKSQPYIKSVQEHKDEEVNWNAGEFRTHHDPARSLAWAHWQYYRGQKTLPRILPDFKSPWLTGIKQDSRGRDRIIVNRTNRYNNRHFRWKDIVTHYGSAILFVGTRDEHGAFCNDFGDVDYQETKDLLEVAQLIGAAAMFIGNQSACFAVAEGMKQKRLLEVCPWQPDVFVEKDDKNFYWSADGALDLPPMLGKDALRLGPKINGVDYLKNPNNQPKTGWKCKGMRDVSYSCLKRQVMRANPLLTDPEAHRVIFDELAEREPSYFFNGSAAVELLLVNQAIANA